MKNKNIKDINVTTQDLKYLGKPLAMLSAVILVFVLTLTVGLRQIKTVDKKLKDANKLKVTLTQNINTLRTVDSEIGTNQNFLEVALPTDNPSLYFISQIRGLAIENSLFLSNIRTSVTVADSKGLSRSNVSFDVEGPSGSITEFINDIGKVLPIGLITKVETSVSGDLVRSSIGVSVFSSKDPDKVPALTTPVSALTAEERQQLIELVGLRLPIFIKPEPSQPQARSDPFN